MNNSNAVIVGRVTKPLEVKEIKTADGVAKSVGNMTVCAVKSVKTSDGTKDVSTFYEVSAWTKTQQDALSELRVGENVLVQGQLEARKYESGKDSGVALSISNAEVHSLGSVGKGVQNIVAVGRATQDVELSETASGHKVAHVSIALNHGADRTSYIEVEVWDAYAETVAKSVKKGSLLTVSGELDLNSYSKCDGGKGAKLRVVNAQIGFMEKITSSGAGSAGQGAGNGGKNSGSSGR